MEVLSLSYKDEARTFLEKSGIDPDIFDWDIAEIMADFARVKVGEQGSDLPRAIAQYGRIWEALDAVVRCAIQGETDECLICEADPDHRHTEDCPILDAELLLNGETCEP